MDGAGQRTDVLRTATVANEFSIVSTSLPSLDRSHAWVRPHDDARPCRQRPGHARTRAALAAQFTKVYLEKKPWRTAFDLRVIGAVMGHSSVRTTRAQEEGKP